MQPSKHNLIGWITGLLMPAWLVVANLISKQSFGFGFFLGGFYFSLLVGLIVITTVIMASDLPVWKRLSFVMASWLLYAGQIALISKFELMRI